MSKKGGKAPKAPDYAKLAKTDAEEQRKTAEMITGWNRPNQTDIYGNTLTWNRDANGNWSQTASLSPQLKAQQDAILGGYFNNMSNLGAQGAFSAPDQLAYSNFAKSAGAPGGGSFNFGGGSGVSPSFEKINKFTNTVAPVGDFSREQGDRVAADMFESAMSRLRPENQRSTDALDLKLRQQGLQPGTEAYNRAMQNMTTSQGDVTAKLGLDSTAAGYNAARDIYASKLAGQGQNFSQALQSYQTNLARQGQLGQQSLGAANVAAQNAATSMQGKIAAGQLQAQAAQQAQSEQQQRWAQALAQYQLPMQQAQGYAGLMGAMPGTKFEGFGSATGYNPASMSNAAQNTYNANMGGYNAQQGKKNSMMGGATTLGAAAMMSDAMLKENITPITGQAALDAILALGGYTYDWKDGTGPDAGVIAQEVERVLPELVTRVESGHMAVKYTQLMAVAVEAIKHLAGELNAIH